MAESKRWRSAWLHMERGELLHSVRTVIAAVLALLIGHLCKLPESYWAAITTLIVMQSTLGGGTDHLEAATGWNGAGRNDGSFVRNLCRAKRDRIRGGHLPQRSDLRTASNGTKRLSLCGNHAGDSHAGGARPACVGYRDSQVYRNLAGYQRGVADDRRVA